MKRQCYFLLVFIFCGMIDRIPVFAQGEAGKELCLWYTQPAAKWTEALPIGNGRMGAMVFGGVFDERIQFNEDTLWTGQPHDYANPDAKKELPKIRQLLLDGKNKEAGQLAKAKFLGNPSRQKAYQPFGDLHLHFAGSGETTNYRRELDLDSALARVSFSVGGVSFKREAFASYPDNVVVLRITANKLGNINFTLGMNSPHTNSQTVAVPSGKTPKSFGGELILSGRVQEGGLKFTSRVAVRTKGGQVMAGNQTLTITNADEVTIYLVAATSFKTFQDVSANPERRSEAALKQVDGRSYDELLARHTADYQNLFRRTDLSLGSDNPGLPTDERLKRVKVSGLTNDMSLAALYFQYGRYLLISSSRVGGQPANLQGVWNELLDPPWESKWTLNINCEMNYWPAEVCNLNECTGPLFDMIDDLAVSGARTAREQYGCHGWVVHHNTDIWRGSAPINGIDGVWPTGGAWLCQHLWEHYLFTGDKKFLARAYPVMKQASEFFLDDLVKEPKTGWLVTSPSYSPEQGDTTMGPTMDNQLVRALMNHTIEAANTLDQDKSFVTKLAVVRDQLPPNQVGKNGQLQEWLEDIDKPNNNHRHMSPLWALFPGADITPAEPKVFEAAKVLLQWRGDGSTGWSYAWRMPLWARVGNGDVAFRQLNGLFQRKTLPNLFDLCGPFQIDGNFGVAAGIAEMLMQSQWTTEQGGKDLRLINLLPALPEAWPTGSVKGVCARDGFVVDLAWDKGALTHAVIHSTLGRTCLVRCGGHEMVLPTKAGKDYEFDGELHFMDTSPTK